MLTVIYGEDTAASRTTLNNVIAEAKLKNPETNITRLVGPKITTADLEQHFAATELFATPKLIIIEELFSAPHSKKRTELITYLGEHHPTAEHHIITWDKKALTPTQIKQLKASTAKEHKLSSSLFKWLDSLKGKPTLAQQKTSLELLRSAIAQNDAFLCFTMLIRQIRLLIQAADGTKMAGAPFMIQKLKGQAASFTMEQLLALHEQLLHFDRAEKTSKNALPLEKRLEHISIGL
jgi:DNA polymerase III delta subunit